jgi:hypothetical protein
MDTYQVNPVDINMFSFVYAIFYIPGSMLSIALYAKFGLSHCIVGGAFFNFLSAWIRTFGAFSPNIDSAYKVQLLGQIFAAIGQPLLLNAPPRYQLLTKFHNYKKIPFRREAYLITENFNIASQDCK